MLSLLETVENAHQPIRATQEKSRENIIASTNILQLHVPDHDDLCVINKLLR